jgi:spermidine synthase
MTDDRIDRRRACRLGEDEGRPALVIDGVVQSVAPVAGGPESGYWWAMLPDARPRRALILGLGGGTIAQLLVTRFGETAIVGVERDPAIVDFARRRLGLDLPGLDVVVADAFSWVPDAAARGERFDFVAVDLFDGADLARGALAKPFLREIRRLLTASGVAAFNLMLSRRLPRQLHRLGEVFRITKAVDEGLNVVVHCR